MNPFSFSTALSITESLKLGGQMILIGMGTVFVVLTLIWGVLVLFKFAFANAGRKKAEVAKAPVQDVKPSGLSEEVIAAISAAIFMAESECGGDVKFRVVSFKRK